MRRRGEERHPAAPRAHADVRRTESDARPASPAKTRASSEKRCLRTFESTILADRSLLDLMSTVDCDDSAYAAPPPPTPYTTPGIIAHLPFGYPSACSSYHARFLFAASARFANAAAAMGAANAASAPEQHRSSPTYSATSHP